MDTHCMQELKTGDALENNGLHAEEGKERKSEEHESEETEAKYTTSSMAAVSHTVLRRSFGGGASVRCESVIVSLSAIRLDPANPRRGSSHYLPDPGPNQILPQ